MVRSYFIYPTNNFGHQHNVQYYFYKTYVGQGNNWANFGLHQVELRNETNQVVEVVGWHFTQGRLEEDFRVSEVKPGLFYSARVVPNSHDTARGVKGAIVCRFKGTNQYFTLAFADGIYDKTNASKGHIEEGSDWERAIWSLKDGQPKELQWGSYQWREVGGKGRSVFTLGKPRF